MQRITLMVLTALLFALPAMAYENVSTTDAYYLATTEANTYILDVRTIAEWKWVGHPGANKLGEGTELGGKVINISNMIELRGEMIDNPFFVADVQRAFPDPEAVTLITMCRSGGRSVAAAEVLEAAGYQNVMNMLRGFEGSSDASGYRTLNGWKVDGLPYTYSGEGYLIGHHGQGIAYGVYE